MTPDLLRDETPTKGNARSSGYGRQTNDWYVEPRRAIDALLDVEKFTGTIYDPACGSGNIPEACLARGLVAFGSDIVDRGWVATMERDFLAPGGMPVDTIITNPPFSLAVDFALKALTITSDRVAILQRTTWLEGERRYQQLFSLGHLRKIWTFRSRISMPPGGSSIPAKGGSVCYSWFVFDHDTHHGCSHGWLK